MVSSSRGNVAAVAVAVVVVIVVVVVVVVMVVVVGSTAASVGRLGFVMDLLRAASALLCAKMYPNPYNLPRLRRGLLLMYLTLNHAGV